MNKTIPVIVIGAGISGIAASSLLSKNGIQHTILESRDRIGGRILAADFNGDRIQLGASMVHHPTQNNCVAQLLKEMEWPIIHGDNQKQQAFCEGIGQLPEQTASKAWNYHRQILQKFKEQGNKSEKDLSIIEAASNYLSELNVQGVQELIVKWVMQIYGCIEGAQTQELSAKQFKICMSQDDYLPVGGYDGLIEAIVKKHSPQILLNKRVDIIDYENQIINIKTESGETYYCERVISSLPLGVLKKKLVIFTPQLPQSYRIAIDNIGNGTLNKLFVSFEQPFWDNNKNILHFYTQQISPFASARAIITQTQNILCFFVAGESNKYISKISKEELIRQLTQFLAKFKFEKEIKVKDTYLKSWFKDIDSLGSYSFFKVGTKKTDFSTLRQSIQNKIWFIGEHCNQLQHACVHSAYQTGVWAAEQISEIYHSK